MSRFTDKLKARSRQNRVDPNMTDQPYVEGQMFDELLASKRISRRKVLGGSMTASFAMMFSGASLVGCDDDSSNGINGNNDNKPIADAKNFAVNFEPVSPGIGNTVTVPKNYEYSVIFVAGDVVEQGGKAYDGTARNIDELQKLAGGDHDGMHLFQIEGMDPNKHGLLVVNHEKDDPVVHRNNNNAITDNNEGQYRLTGVGVSIIEIENKDGQWQVVVDSKFNRRLTGLDEYAISGPAIQSIATAHKKDTVTGTLNNCANGYTPWGTYLTCEESEVNYFDESQPMNGYGWIVEIDPFDPTSIPVKHTAMGRFAHENTAFLSNDNGDIAFYMGDDSRPGCIYKFVPNGRINKSDAKANRTLLTDGTLYVAKFKEDGTGEWLEMTYGKNGLDENAKDPGKYVNYASGEEPQPVDFPFTNQADVLIHAYEAGRIAGGTLMDRPEWITVAPEGDIYCTLTNNSSRQQADAANPRTENKTGQIVHWVEDNNDPQAMTFKWDLLLLAGDPRYATLYPGLEGNIKGDTFSSPDGLRVDPQGRMWVQTDASTGGETQMIFGNNSLYSVDRKTGESKRFLVGPNGCEITGIAYTPDLTTLFINIQHPDPEGQWPSLKQGTDLPGRSATIAIRHKEGKPFGSM